MYARWREKSTGELAWGSCGTARLVDLQTHLEDFSEEQLQQFGGVANQGRHRALTRLFPGPSQVFPRFSAAKILVDATARASMEWYGNTTPQPLMPDATQHHDTAMW